MAIIVRCKHADQFLARMRTAIESGRVDTWIVDDEGDYTYRVPAWTNLAWMRPRLDAGKLTFNIVSHERIEITKSIYALFHGRFVEMLLAEFDGDFENVTISALAAGGDVL